MLYWFSVSEWHEHLSKFCYSFTSINEQLSSCSIHPTILFPIVLFSQTNLDNSFFLRFEFPNSNRLFWCTKFNETIKSKLFLFFSQSKKFRNFNLYQCSFLKPFNDFLSNILSLKFPSPTRRNWLHFLFIANNIDRTWINPQFSINEKLK